MVPIVPLLITQVLNMLIVTMQLLPCSAPARIQSTHLLRISALPQPKHLHQTATKGCYSKWPWVLLSAACFVYKPSCIVTFSSLHQIGPRSIVTAASCCGRIVRLAEVKLFWASEYQDSIGINGMTTWLRLHRDQLQPGAMSCWQHGSTQRALRLLHCPSWTHPQRASNSNFARKVSCCMLKPRIESL